MAHAPPALPTHRAQGEHLLHVLNTLESRAVVLEAELREVDEDILQNSTMAKKYGAEFFTEGDARLAQTRVRRRRLPPARRYHCARVRASWLCGRCVVAVCAFLCVYVCV